VIALRPRVRALAGAARGRFDGSLAQVFIRQLGALDVANTSIIFGAALLTSVLPFIILLSSLANHRIDNDLSRHIGLDRQGALIVSELFRPSPVHPVVELVTALIFTTGGTMAVAGSLRLIYERVFGLPHRGWKDAPGWLPGLGFSSASWSRRS